MKPISLIRSICHVSAFLLLLSFFQSCSKGGSNHTPPGNTSPVITSLNVTSGDYTTPILIKGTGFSATIADDKVFFNGVQATVTGASSTLIYTSVPLAAGTGNVTVTVNGSTATGPTFTYLITEVASLLAGNNGYGSANGAGTTASFSQGLGLATDAAGNIYVADQLNDLIRKITPAGLVTTLAGSGAPGSADGAGTAASFNKPADVATDAAGNVYVADSNNGLIRKITPAGQVSTVTVNASGNPVKYGNPAFVELDGSGNIFFADLAGSIIREISPAGVVTTPYNETATNVNIYGFVIDKMGNFFIVDDYNNQVDKLTAAGSFSVFAGNYNIIGGDLNGTGTAASFYKPFVIAMDKNGNLYVADTGNAELREITPAAVVTTFGGPGGDYIGPITQVDFFGVEGMTVDASGNVYFSVQNSILKISMQ